MSKSTHVSSDGEPDDLPSRGGLKLRWKILGGICLTIIGTIVAMWVAGGQTYIYASSVQIEAPADRVFAYLTESDKLIQWMGGLKEVKELTDNGHEIGAKAMAVIEENGNRFELQSEVTDTRDDEMLVVRLTSSMFEITNSYELQADGGQTNVLQKMSANYTGIARFFAPLTGGAVQEKMDADFAKLKSLLEKKS